MNYSERKIYSLIEQAHSGRQKAYLSLLKFYWNDIYSYINVKLRDKTYVEDLTISTFTKAFSKLYLYESRYDFKTWLISIAHNNVIDFVRKKNKYLLIYNIDELFDNVKDNTSPSPEEIVLEKQKIIEIRKYVDRLKPMYRDVIVLKYFKDCSQKEISAELGLTLSNVKIRLMRGKKILSDYYRSIQV
ncbi:RNA polymerase sigma factor [Ichthyobacterium seriolicida]|uniref:RNA polymerase sigma-70 factor n=1 Tax=Ichthyobacterium seriolicida TaxID=242600 RepID=A0A1J1E396_9FLAO|nr:RNA polymerase sigma factor [Ichthyobacterium seriolicida]BAV95453.1 RNA polymerase sigma-70 factor [Ichthyobacterium seriolicida]